MLSSSTAQRSWINGLRSSRKMASIFFFGHIHPLIIEPLHLLGEVVLRGFGGLPVRFSVEAFDLYYFFVVPPHFFADGRCDCLEVMVFDSHRLGVPGIDFHHHINDLPCLVKILNGDKIPGSDFIKAQKFRDLEYLTVGIECLELNGLAQNSGDLFGFFFV